LAAALVQGGVKNASKITPNKGEGPVRVEGELAEEANLAETAEAVNEAQTPHKGEHAPGLSLVLYAELDTESSAKALEALAEIEGVDAEASTTDEEEGEISAKIKGILEALKNAGIEASTTKDE
jgi:hypothetical protein